jgi:hypothetical protein
VGYRFSAFWLRSSVVTLIVLHLIGEAIVGKIGFLFLFKIIVILLYCFTIVSFCPGLGGGFGGGLQVHQHL